MINKDGGGTIFRFYGVGHSCYEGVIELMEVPPLGKTLYYYRITSLFSLDLSFHSRFYVVLSLGIKNSLLFSIEFRPGSTKNEQSVENTKVIKFIKCNLFERRAFKVSFLEISLFQ